MTPFSGKTLMITGGTGSFGEAVLKRFLDTDIAEIRIFSRDEKKQDDMRHHYQNDKIKYVQADGYGNPEEFLQDQRRNIHAAGAGPQPDDHRQGNADAQAAEEGTEERIPRSRG